MKLPPKAGVRHQFTVEQVTAITADINYSYIHLITGERLYISRTLKWCTERWPSLVRIHKNAMINLDHVYNYGQNAGRQQTGYVIMKTNLRLDVSRRRLKEVIQLIESQNTQKPDMEE